MTKGEKLGYLTATLLLIFGGAIVRTYILNWLVGPATVVVSVAFWVWFTDREVAR